MLSKRLQIYRLLVFYHLHRIDSLVLRRWTHDHRKATTIDQRPPATQPALELFHTGIITKQRWSDFMPGSSLGNILGRLQTSMPSGSPPPWPLSSWDAMETTNRADVICFISIYTVNNAAKERGLLRVWSMLLRFTCLQANGHCQR